MTKTVVTLLLLGASCVVAGVALLSVPLALIVAGVLLLVAGGLSIEVAPDDDEETP